MAISFSEGELPLGYTLFCLYPWNGTVTLLARTSGIPGRILAVFNQKLILEYSESFANIFTQSLQGSGHMNQIACNSFKP